MDIKLLKQRIGDNTQKNENPEELNSLPTIRFFTPAKQPRIKSDIGEGCHRVDYYFIRKIMHVNSREFRLKIAL